MILVDDRGKFRGWAQSAWHDEYPNAQEFEIREARRIAKQEIANDNCFKHIKLVSKYGYENEEIIDTIFPD